MKITGAVRKAIQKEVLILIDKGYTKEEIATLYGMTRANVYKIINNNKKSIQKVDKI